MKMRVFDSFRKAFESKDRVNGKNVKSVRDALGDAAMNSFFRPSI